MNTQHHPIKRDYYVIIERDEDGLYVGEIPQLDACYSQGKSIDELICNIKEVLEICLDEQESNDSTEFIGIYKVTI